MAGIVHGFAKDGRSLSIFNHTISQLAKRLLP
ncbi:RAxF-45 family protein [Paenibacillus nanensis]